MENLFKIKNLIFIVLLSLVQLQWVYSQKRLVAHTISGEPYIEVNDSIKTLTKGTIIDNKTTLVMQPKDEVTLINKEGEITRVINTGQLTLEELSKLPKVKDNSSTVKKYFSYFWKEITNTMASDTNGSGVVYRGDEDILLQFPSHNSLILGAELNFEWQPIDGKEKNYYFVLLDSSNEVLLTLGTPSTKLSLLLDNKLLKKGETYHWCITETAYSSTINDLPKNSFTLLSVEDTKGTSKEIITLSQDLLKLGFKKENLKSILCLDFKICF
ncbi:hypothetical protein RM697_02840 [Ichthyenterobacterium sp. W332]|uniref:Uncharacterized protein n=1 Tax=Microcosmobacter mediterraneus TaxID=3075607 RepID=A0ABU2YHD1_9FLAO|nr:hypothetical protein [Ichthyenterobacterium sp. W332]MDT0557569.1 hypothetical protein [Ichthyenterobacterium sp. W332]